MEIHNLPQELGEYLDQAHALRTEGKSPPLVSLDELFPDKLHTGIKNQLKSGEIVNLTDEGGTPHFVGADIDSQGNVFTVAAAIPRNPGRSERFLQQVSDFMDSNMERADRIQLYHSIYKAEGLVNNAINKAAALVATEGSFKVRYVKGQRGRPSDKRAEELRLLLQFWAENVNARATDAVVTGTRGVKAIISQGARQALIEGDNIARTNWTNVNVPVLKGASYSLPMNIQFFSAAHIEIPDEIVGTGIELLYWVPPSEFIQSLEDPKDENVKEYIDKLIPPEVQQELISKERYFLDPALMIHIKHRGTGTEAFGESMISAAMSDIAYKRALQALDIVTIENLINRLVIVKVGSDNQASVYHKQEVTARRLQLLQRMFAKIGPSATLLWGGPDIDVVEVGAHNKILEMDERYKIADRRIRGALGIPAVLLTGEASEGKAAGWAATVGSAAQLKELQDQYAQMLRTIAERIAEENGFEDVDVVWEFHQALLANKELNANIALKAYAQGLYSTQTALEELGQNPEAEEVRQAEDVSRGFKHEPFGLPMGVLTTNPTGVGEGKGDRGRPTNEERPDADADPRENQETQTTEENK